MYVCIVRLLEEYVFGPLEVWINGRMFGEESGGGAGSGGEGGLDG